jgi:hypothetical protein
MRKDAELQIDTLAIINYETTSSDLQKICEQYKQFLSEEALLKDFSA